MIRKLTLEEWFSQLQLEHIQRHHVHTASHLRVDLTDFTKYSYAALMIRAMSRLLATTPAVNRMLFKTFYGRRVVEFPYVAVNVPLKLDLGGGRSVLSACIIRDGHLKTIGQIQDELRAARAAGLSDKPIAKIVATGRNTFFNRLRLRLIHFVVFNFPAVVLKRRAGGTAVSSLYRSELSDIPVSAISYGPSAATLFLGSTVQKNGRTEAEIGLAYDHSVISGEWMFESMLRLQKIISEEVLENGTRNNHAVGSVRPAAPEVR